MTTRTVTSHVSSRCAVPVDPYGAFRAEGDFAPAGEDDLFLSRVGVTLGHLPSSSRALVVSLTDSSGGAWSGRSPVAPTGDVDVMLWPGGDPCALAGGVGVVESGSRSAGLVDATHALVVGGFPLSAVQPQSFVADLGTARVRPLALGPTTPRANATVTSVAGGALLAGGARSDDPNGVLATAELYDAAKGDFDGQPITLGVARTKHCAVAVDGGRVLLVGGSGGAGALGATELVDPVARRSLLGGMPILKPRVSPLCARLADGRVLVAGGFDGAGPVSTVELLSSDGKRLVSGQLTLSNARRRQAMVALEGGGALFVAAPGATDDASTFSNVALLTAQDQLVTPPRVQGALADPRLFAGADGKPVLWTGDRWLVWDPWQQRFDPLADALGDRGPEPDAPIASPDPGLLLWFTDAGDVTGRRFSTRDAWVNDQGALLTVDVRHLAPESPFADALAFDADRGLSLPPGNGAFVTDARYLGASVDVDATVGVPIVVLRAASGVEVELGGGACPWPPVALPATFHVEARGAAISYGSGASFADCSSPFAARERFAIGLRGGPAHAKNLRIAR